MTFLTPRRLHYAWIVSAVLWTAWLASNLLGKGNFDLAGQVVGTDYLQFYAAGLTLRQGQSASLYDFAYQQQLEQAIAGPELTQFHAFITPPFLAWLIVPFSWLPYGFSYLCWSLLGLAALWLSIRLLVKAFSTRTLFWTLTWFPVFASISFGQNSLLSLLIVCLVYRLWEGKRPYAAGLIASLLLYKPQLTLGIAFLWLLELRLGWRALLGMAIGGIALAGLSFGLLPEASRAYLEFSRDSLGRIASGLEFPIWHSHTLRTFWQLIFQSKTHLAEGLYFITAAGGVLAFSNFSRRVRGSSWLLFSGAIFLTIWTSPHAMIYDWVLLLVPAILLWRNLPDSQISLKPIYAGLWVATLVSGPLVVAQLKFLPGAIQVSLPVFLYSIAAIYRLASSWKAIDRASSE